MKYNKPCIEIAEADFGLLSGSGPNAGDIFSPTVSDDAKGHSVWDDDSETHYYNIKEKDYEVHD